MSLSREDYLKALTEDPFDLATRCEFARYLLAIGDIDDAVKQLNMLLNQEPDNEEYKKLYAHCVANIETTDVPPVNDENNVVQFSIVESDRKQSGEERPAQITAITRTGRVTFQDIVGMDDLKKTIRVKIIEPFSKPGLFSKFKKSTGGGIMLYGPPGCGKTMMGRAIASEIRAEFIPVEISDVLNMYVGQSESNLRDIFETARASKPCVLFFDELDALAISRSKSHSDHSRTLVNEFLLQLDGIGNDNDQVLILGATNMPWDVDGAAKRPGRFSRQIFVPPPDLKARAAMFERKLVDVPTGELNYQRLGEISNLFTGADVEGVIDRAKEVAILDMIEAGTERNLTQGDLETAVMEHVPTSTDWLKTAKNLVKFGGVDKSYKEVATYLKAAKI